MTTTVAVVGGGALGVTAAADLARGADVTLYERGDLAAESTGRAAGVCYDAFASQTDAAVGKRAQERFREFPDVFTDCPYVWLARMGDDRRAAAIREQVSRMVEHGVDVSLADSTDLAEWFPALETDDIAVAAIARNAGYADTVGYVEAMAERARTAGASIRTHTPVAVRTDSPKIITSNDERAFDAVLVAAGAHTKRVLAEAGIALALKPYRVQALVTEPMPASENLPMCFDATGDFYFRPHTGGLLVGDGTERTESDPDEWTREASAGFVESARERLAERVRGSVEEIREAWAGLCTATPDGDPLLGEVRPGIFVASGFHGHGFMRAPALGETIAEQVLGGDGIPRFDPTRFEGSEEFEIVAGMDIE
ncbi:MAG TPA: FAD-dependent oxidoreductase [Halococcus sp.]|nr:FAD-dependent oxidoreductase [Halococcus sp.]